jgi:hypothetical protein
MNKATETTPNKNDQWLGQARRLSRAVTAVTRLPSRVPPSAYAGPSVPVCAGPSVPVCAGPSASVCPMSILLRHPPIGMDQTKSAVSP